MSARIRLAISSYLICRMGPSTSLLCSLHSAATKYPYPLPPSAKTQIPSCARSSAVYPRLLYSERRCSAICLSESPCWYRAAIRCFLPVMPQSSTSSLSTSIFVMPRETGPCASARCSGAASRWSLWYFSNSDTRIRPVF